MKIVEFTCHRNIEYYKRLLKENPGLGFPERLEGLDLEESVFERKAAGRCYDAARMELGIKKPSDIQQENSIFTGMRPRWVRLNAYAQA